MRVGAALFACLVGVAPAVHAQEKPLREWMQDARVPETRAAALARFRAATQADLPELRLLVDDARRVPGEGIARMLEDPRKACRGAAADPDKWLVCLVEKLEGKATVNAKSATELACALLGARAVKGIDGYALVASVALDAKGAFEQAVGTTLRSGGDEAVAALYTVRRDAAVPLRKWATERLDAMKKRKPADVATMTDAHALARVLAILGGWREPDALALLMDHADVDRREVRDAARAGVRAFGRDAIWKLREAWRNVTGEAAPEDWYSKRLADELFARLDAQRLGPASAALEAAREKAKAGDVREAAANAELALRLSPDHPERVELARFLVAAGRDVAGGRSAEERESLLQRAAWAGGPELAAELAPEIRALHADALAHRGVVDTSLTGVASTERPIPRAPLAGLRLAWGLAALATALAAAGAWASRRAASTGAAGAPTLREAPPPEP
jgi:GNAT superfamily N-acetyltransferase